METSTVDLEPDSLVDMYLDTAKLMVIWGVENWDLSCQDHQAA